MQNLGNKKYNHLKKVWSDIYNNKDEPQKHYVRWKPDAKHHRLYDSIYGKCQKEKKKKERKRKSKSIEAQSRLVMAEDWEWK